MRMRRRGGSPLQSMLRADVVCIIDASVCMFVWVGTNAFEEDEALAMNLAYRYAKRLKPALQVSHVLPGAEPDEFRRVFHGWMDMPYSVDALAQRRDAAFREAGLIGTVLREHVWPTIASPSAGPLLQVDRSVLRRMVVFTSSCNIIRGTRARSRRACALLGHLGARFQEVDLSTQPTRLGWLKRLLDDNGLKHACHRGDLPFVFLDEKLVSCKSRFGLQELHDEGDLIKRIPVRQTLALGSNIVPLAQFVAVDDLRAEDALHAGWLLREGDLLKLWKRRWGVVHVNRFYLFKSAEPNEKAESIFDITGVSVRSVQSDFHFEVSTHDRTLLFRVDRQDDREPEPQLESSAMMQQSGKALAAWMAAFQRALQLQSKAA